MLITDYDYLFRCACRRFNLYFAAALAKASECDTSNWEKIPIGLFYTSEKPTYNGLDVTLKEGPLVKRPLSPSREELIQIKEEFR